MPLLVIDRPAMIRSELRWALGRRPAEEEGGASVQPVGQLQSLIAQKMQRAQELLEELRLQVTTRFSDLSAWRIPWTRSASALLNDEPHWQG